MSTITDEATILEGQSTNSPGAEHPGRAVDAPPPTRRRRTALGWIGGGITIVAVASASLLITSDDHTSVNDVGQTEPTGDHGATELDVRGIPVSWSQEGGAPRAEDVTELDVRGVPIWWSASGS